jgi:hypothetical protein
MDVQFHQLLGVSAANHGKSQSKMAGVSAEIRTEHLPNYGLQRYRCAAPFGRFLPIQYSHIILPYDAIRPEINY